MNFLKNLSANIPATEIAKKGSLSYISAATAVARADRPNFKFVEFPDENGALQPYQAFLGGAVVATDVDLSNGQSQRVYLPVMDRDNYALSIANLSLTDVNNSRQRCLVKAIAAVTGVGMSVFLGHDGDGAKAAKILGLEESSDLATANALIKTLAEGGAPYIEWTAGLSAARITDENFFWSIVCYDGLPFREVLGGLQVDVLTEYKGRSQTIGLPIMDSAFNVIPAGKATVLDWNKTAMRVLAKGIAFNSGYGLPVYSDETIAKAEAVARSGRKPTKAKDEGAKAPAPAPAPTKDAAVEKAQDPAPAETTAQPPAAALAPAEASAPAAAEAPAQSQATANSEASAPAVAEEQAAVAKADAPVAEQAQDTASAPAADTSTQPEAAQAAEGSAPEQEFTPDPVRQEAVERFQRVMRERNEKYGFEGLISVFRALAVSDKFRDEDKPVCFVALVSNVATQVTPAHIKQVLDEIGEYSVANKLPEPTRRLVSVRLTTVAIEAALPKGDQAVVEAAEAIVKSGLAEDISEVFEFSQEGELAPETKEYLAAVLDHQPA